MSSIHANTRRLFKDKGEVREFPQVQILRQKADRKKVCYLKAILQFFFIYLVRIRRYNDL